MKREAKLKPVAKKRAKQTRAYSEERRYWLEKPGNDVCAVCLCRSTGRPWREVKAGILSGGAGQYVARGGILTRSSEVHHFRGRIGRLLCDPRFFIGTCRGCREWPHENPVQARELHLLAPPNEWNVFPGPGVPGFPGE